MAEAKFRNFRKTAAILMLVSFIFGAASPAMASTGIGAGYGAFRVDGILTLGTKADFLGRKWMLYNIDPENSTSSPRYAYVITNSTMGMSRFKNESRTDDTDNYYAYSALRGKVSNATATGPQSGTLEAQMIAYDPATYTGTEKSGMLSWIDINGGMDRTSGSAEYIAKHYMPGEPAYNGTTSVDVTEDKLYILSKDEASTGWFTNDTRRREPSRYQWWLRSPISSDAYTAQKVTDRGSLDNFLLGGEMGVRPALQINIDSSLFVWTLFATVAGTDKGKAAVNVGTGFKLPNAEGTEMLNKQTVEYDSTKKTTYYDQNNTLLAPASVAFKTTENNETVEDRITAKVGNIVNLTHPLFNTKDLWITYNASNALTAKDGHAAAQHIAAVVKKDGQYVNYAKLGTVEDSHAITGADTDGYFKIDTSQLGNGTYELYIYSEKIDGTVEDPRKVYNATKNPTADAASKLLKASGTDVNFSTHIDDPSDTFTLDDNTFTNYGNINAFHKNDGLEANIGGGFDLLFENETYDTSVTVGDSQTGTITADATNGTTLTGNVTVGNGATLTTVNEFTLKGTNSINGTVTGDALTIAGGTTTVGSTGSIANALTVGENGTLSVSATGLMHCITNNGTVNLTGGTLNKAIANSGTVKLDGAELGGAYITGGTLEFSQDLATNANYVTADINTINSGKTLTLNDGILAKAVSGNGNIAIAGEVSSNADNFGNDGSLSVASDTLTLTDGTLNKTITGAGNIVIAGNVSSTAANFGNSGSLSVTGANGNLTLTAGALAKDIANAGTVKFDAGSGNTMTASGSFTGNGTLEAVSGTLNYTGSSIANNVKIYSGATLDPNANVFSGDIENNGTLVLTGDIADITAPVAADTGYLNANITGSGTLQIGDGANPAHVYLGSEGQITAGTLDVKTDATYTGTLAAMTITNAITNAGTLNITGGELGKNIANSGSVTLETGAAFGTDGKITGGNATLKDGVEFTGKNLTGNALTANGAIYNVGAKLTDDAAGITLSEGSLINAASATGTITLGDINLTGNNYDSWGRTTYRQLKYLAAAGSNNMEISEAKVAINDGTEYSFNQAYETAGDNTTAKKYGWIDVFKKAAPYTLKQLVNADAIAEATTNDKYILETDETQTETLGNLKRAADKQGMPRSLTITSKEGELHTLNGGGNGGITVAGEGGGADDTLKLQNITVKNFSTAVTVNEGGNLTMDEVTFAGTTGNADVINNGTLSMGEVVFNKGVKGTGEMMLNDNFTSNTAIEQGKISIMTAAATLTNNGTITADITNEGTIITDADKITGSIKNNNKLTLTGGTADETISEDKFAKLGSDVAGSGTTIIDGYVNAADKKLETAVTVNDDKGLYIKADGIKKAVANEGLLLLSDGTLTQNVTGSGDTSIRGNVEIGAEISQDNIVVETGSLTTNANLIKGGLINNETVNFTGGTLEDRYVSIGGMTNINGKMKFSDKVTLENSTLNFCLDGFAKGDTIVETAEKVDLTDTTVGLIQKENGYKLDKEGDTITLITNAGNYEYSEIKTQEGARSYTYSVGLDGGALMLGYLDQGISDHTKSFSEARLAGLAAINSGSDLVATEVMENASAETKEWEAFAAIQGSRSRYETGSHIDLNSTNVAAGLSKKVKDNITLGLFAEGGNGRYTTYNEFEDNDVRADGDINYFGGGIFAKVEGKKTAKGQLHGEASFRAGHVSSDYNSETFELGKQTRFDTSNAYIGAHAGLGYKWNVKDGGNVDTYVKYLWNRQNSDSIKIEDDTFELDTINSHRLRAGFRYNGKENDKGIKFYGGLAYEYEFDGKATGHMEEYAILEPDYKGGSGIAEIGFKYDKANSPWKVELGVTGAAGKRDSIGINLGATYEFGK